MKADTTELARTAAEFRQFDSSRWDAFVRAFASYSARMTSECLEADLASLPQAQARAQQARVLLKIFSTTSTTKG